MTGGTTLDRTVPFDSLPVFVRGGSILPLAPVVQHTRDLPGGPLDLHVYPGRDATFTLVEDDGSTNAYAGGVARKTNFTWTDATRTLAWSRTGSYDGPTCFRSLRVTVPGAAATPEQPLGTTGQITVAAQ